MSDEVYEAFKRVVVNRKAPVKEEIIDGFTGFLFLDDRGKATVGYYWEHKFKQIIEKHNKIYKDELPKITPHMCRHTYCTRLAGNGVSVITIKYLMGHSDIGTSMRYTHTDKEDAEKELRRIEAMREIERIKEEEKQRESECRIIDFNKLA